MSLNKAQQRPAWLVLRCDGAASPVKEFVQQHLQAPLQFSVAVLLCSLLVFVRALTFPLACLAGCYTVVLHLQQSRNQHVGTLLLSSSGMLGAVWLGVLTAGCLATITFQAPTPTIQYTVLTLLSSLTFAVYGIVKVTPMPVRLTLQGSNLMITFGMSVVLSLFAPDVSYMWSTFLGNLALAFTAAALAVSLSGIVILPSLATEAALTHVVTALRKTGQASTICVSILLRPGADGQRSPAADNDATSGKPVHNWQQQQQQQALAISSRQPVEAKETSFIGGQTSTRPLPLPGRLKNLLDQTLNPSLSAHHALVPCVSVGCQDGQQQSDHARILSVTTISQPPEKSSASTQSGSVSVIMGSTNLAQITGDTSQLITATAAAAAAAAAADTSVGKQVVINRTAAAVAQADKGSTGISSNCVAAAATAAVGEYDENEDEGDDVVIDVDLQTLKNSALQHKDSSGRNPAGIRILSSSSGTVLLRRKQNRLGLNLLQQRSRSYDNHHHHHPHHHDTQQQQQQQWTGYTQQQAHTSYVHQLSHKVAKIRPHLVMVRKLHDAVAVEQALWVRLLVAGVPLMPRWQMQDWQQLVDALVAVIERVAALEGSLEAGCHQHSNHHHHHQNPQWANCGTLRSTCSQIFAQTAALCGGLSIALQAKLQQQQQQQQQGITSKLLRCCLRNSSSNDLRSRTGSTGSSHPMFQISWEAARQQLIEKRHSEMQRYVTPAGAEPQSAPLKKRDNRTQTITNPQHVVHSPQHSVICTGGTVGAVFLCTLGLGVIEAAEKLQAAGQLVLYGRQMMTAAAAAAAAGPAAAAAMPAAGPAAAAEAGFSAVRTAAAQPAPSPPAAAQAAVEEDKFTAQALHSAAAADLNLQPRKQAATAATAADVPTATTEPAAASAGAVMVGQRFLLKPNSRYSSSSSGVGGVGGGGSVAASSGTAVLLDSLLCLSLFRRLKGPLLEQLPGALASVTALLAMFHKRRFQAGVKLWFVSSAGLTVMVVTSRIWPHIPPNIMMVALKAIVFSMKERVEASTEMVIMRVAATVIGVCFGHLLMFNPASADQPWGLAAALLFFGLVVPPFTSGQYCMLLCLGLITLYSTVLCQYVGCCDSAGKLEYFYGRIAATAGGALFSMLVNRLVMPWERDSWALEEVGQVLGLGVAAAKGMYDSQYKYLRNTYDSCAAAAAAASAGNGSSSSKLWQAQPQQLLRTVENDTNKDYVAVPMELQQQQQQHWQRLLPGAIPPANISQNTTTAAAAAVAATGDTQPPSQNNINWPYYSRSQQQQQQQQQPSRPQQQQQQQQSSRPQSQQQPVFDAGVCLSGIKAVLAPVLLAVQRDTWMTWKWGELAVPPVVPKSLSAVQQLSDALAALKVIQDQQQQHQQSPQQQQQQQQHTQRERDSHGKRPAAAAAPEVKMSLHSNGISSSGGDNDGKPQQKPDKGYDQCSSLLLVDRSVQQQLHDYILGMFEGLQELVLFVQQQVRDPTDSRQATLKDKVCHVQQLLSGIQLEDGPGRSSEHWSTLVKQQQQQDAHQQQQQQQQGLGQQPHQGANQEQQQQQGADREQQQQQQQRESFTVKGLDSLASQAKFVQLQYLSFVYALRYVFKRTIAVAACIAND